MFTLELSHADGSLTQVPVDFNFTEADMARAVGLAEPDDPLSLTAALLFARLDRPADDWPIIGPVLYGLLTGDTDHLEVA